MEPTPEFVVCYDKETKLYSFNNQNCPKNKFGLYVNEELVSSTGLVCTTIKPKKVHFIAEKSVLIGYKNSKTGQTIPIDEFNDKITLIRSKGTVDDDSDENDYIFENAEDEVEYIRFLKDYSERIYESIDVLTEYEIKFVNKPVSEYPEIQPMASLSDVISCKDGYFQYTECSAQYLKEICERKGLKCDIHNNSKGIEFSKVENEYLYYNGGQKPPGIPSIGTYKDLVEARQRLINWIEDKVNQIILKTKPESISITACVPLIKNLCDEISGLRSFNIKQVDYSRYLTKCTTLESLRDKLLNGLVDSNPKVFNNAKVQSSKAQ